MITTIAELQLCLGLDENPLQAEASEESKPSLCRRREWTPEEDACILRMARERPHWRRIAKSVPGRTDDAIRNRYNRLTNRVLIARCSEKSNSVRERWSEDDDLTLVAAVAEMGMQWSKIQASRFPNRTVYAVRNRHNRLLAKQM